VFFSPICGSYSFFFHAFATIVAVVELTLAQVPDFFVSVRATAIAEAWSSPSRIVSWRIHGSVFSIVCSLLLFVGVLFVTDSVVVICINLNTVGDSKMKLLSELGFVIVVRNVKLEETSLAHWHAFLAPFMDNRNSVLIWVGNILQRKS
jgi:hypothetical protein